MADATFLIQCFGIFRKFGESLSVDLPLGSSVQQVKQAIVDLIGTQHKTLVEESVLADEDSILPNAYVLEKPASLSILPPVCGG